MIETMQSTLNQLIIYKQNNIYIKKYYDSVFHVEQYENVNIMCINITIIICKKTDNQYI